MLPLVETHCRYILPARYEDVLTIKTYITELSPVKVRFGYDVVRKMDNALLAKGETLLAFTDTNFRPVNLKKFRPDIWEYVQKMQ